MADQTCEILEFPDRAAFGRDYSTGWMDGCAYGERFTSISYYCLGVFSGVILSVLVGALIYWWVGTR